MVRLPQGDGVALGVVDDSEETHSPTTRIVLAFLTSVVIEFGVAISVSVRKICEIPKKNREIKILLSITFQEIV